MLMGYPGGVDGHCPPHRLHFGAAQGNPKDVALRLQGVFHHPAVLDDALEMLIGFEQGLERARHIAIDHQEIGPGVGFDHAQFGAEIGIALTGQRQQFAVLRGGLFERVQGRIPIFQGDQPHGLVMGFSRREQNVAAPAGLHLVFDRQFVGPPRSGGDLVALRLRAGIGHWRRGGLRQEGLQRPPDTFVCHQAHGGLVGQLAVLDDLDAGLDAALHALGQIDVGHDVSTPILGGFHRRAQFGQGELYRIEWIVERRRAASGHELDLRSAAQQLLAGGLAHTVGAVGNGRRAQVFGMAYRATGRARPDLVQKAEVAVPCGLRNHGATWKNARPLHQSLVDGALERKHRPACVAHRSETSQQGALRLRTSRQVNQRGIGHEQVLHGHRRHQAVPMRIDQPRHEHPAAAVDDLRTPRCALPLRLDGPNPRAFDHDLQAWLQAGAPTIEKLHIAQNHRRCNCRCRPGGRWLRRSGRAEPANACSQNQRALQKIAARKSPLKSSLHLRGLIATAAAIKGGTRRGLSAGMGSGRFAHGSPSNTPEHLTSGLLRNQAPFARGLAAGPQTGGLGRVTRGVERHPKGLAQPPFLRVRGDQLETAARAALGVAPFQKCGIAAQKCRTFFR